MRPQARHLGLAAQLLRLQIAHASPFDGKRVDDRDGPEAVVHLRVEDAEERGAHDDERVAARGRHVQAQLGDVERDDAVQQTEYAAERGGDADSGEQPLAGGHAAAQRPAERGRESQHEQRELEGHEGRAREDAGVLPCGNHVGRQLKQHHPHHDGHTDGAARAQPLNGGARLTGHRRGNGRPRPDAPRSGRDGQSTRCFHGYFSVQRVGLKCPAAGRKLRRIRPRKATARHLRSAASGSDGILGGEIDDADGLRWFQGRGVIAAVGMAFSMTAASGRAQEAPAPPSPPARAPAQRVLSLPDMERTALQVQPQLLAARATTGVAQAQAEQARSPLLPQIIGSGAAYTRETGNFAPRPGTTPLGTPVGGTLFSTSFDYWQVPGLTATQLIYDFGQTSEKYDAAKLNTDAQRWRRADRQAHHPPQRAARILRGESEQGARRRRQGDARRPEQAPDPGAGHGAGRHPAADRAGATEGRRGQRRRAGHHVAEQLRDLEGAAQSGYGRVRRDGLRRQRRGHGSHPGRRSAP